MSGMGDHTQRCLAQVSHLMHRHDDEGYCVIVCTGTNDSIEES